LVPITRSPDAFDEFKNAAAAPIPGQRRMVIAYRKLAQNACNELCRPPFLLLSYPRKRKRRTLAIIARCEGSLTPFTRLPTRRRCAGSIKSGTAAASLPGYEVCLLRPGKRHWPVRVIASVSVFRLGRVHQGPVSRYTTASTPASNLIANRVPCYI